MIYKGNTVELCFQKIIINISSSGALSTSRQYFVAGRNSCQCAKSLDILNMIRCSNPGSDVPNHSLVPSLSASYLHVICLKCLSRFFEFISESFISFYHLP